MGRATLFATLCSCLWGRSQRGNSAAHHLVSSALSSGLLCETGSFSHCGNPYHSPHQLWVSVSPSASRPSQSTAWPQFFSAGPAHMALLPVLTSLVVLADFFFNSLVVRVPCSLIFWLLWLFIDFRLVVILLLVVRGSKGFPPMPPSWPEPFISNTILWSRNCHNSHFINKKAQRN